MPIETKNTEIKTAETTDSTISEAELKELQSIFQQINQAGQETLQRINGMHASLQDILNEVRAARR